jgi:CBS domain-containing protein
MKIKDILKSKGSRIWTIKASQTIQEALQLLVTQRIGALLVTDDSVETIVGLLSERDLVRGSYSSLKSTRDVLVREWMTRHVITCAPDDEVSEVMRIMTDKRVRHVPVAEGDELLGLVSIGDVVKAILEESSHQIKHLKDYVFGNYSDPAES